jgi:RNA polymerase sigma factor (sigma-70 family)
MATGTTINDASIDATSNTADLLPRVSDGDSAAWEEILRRYGTLVSTIVRSFRLQDADTLDAMQTTWLRLAENAHQVQHPERLGGWLATTARRECLRILRHITPIPHPLETDLEAVADPTAGPEQSAIETDSTRTLWKHVDELPPRRRTLLRALFTDNARPYAEIANDTGIPPGAIGPTRTRALQQLRDRLDKPNPEQGFGQ